MLPPQAADAPGDGQSHRGIEHDDGVVVSADGPRDAFRRLGIGPRAAGAAMLSAWNEATAVHVGALLQAIGVPSGGTGSSLTSAFLRLSNLDPAAELQRFRAGLSSDAVSWREPGG